jgi:guanylate kinase
MARGRLFIVSAPSGAGKTTLVRAVAETTSDLVISISHTTRARRPGEKDGIHYHYVDPETFRAMVAAGGFLEHAEVYGNLYGTSRSAVEAQMAEGCDVLLEIDWQGARQIRTTFAESVAIFILPPSLGELEARLVNRGEDDAATIARRLAMAADDLAHFPEYDYLVVNDDFERAAMDLKSILRAFRLTTAYQCATGTIQGILHEGHPP